jgi:hypothetical protein
LIIVPSTLMDFALRVKIIYFGLLKFSKTLLHEKC